MTSATATPFPETIVALRSGLLKLFRDWWRGERLIGKLALPPPPKFVLFGGTVGLRGIMNRDS